MNEVERTVDPMDRASRGAGSKATLPACPARRTFRP